jgi:hypothetical protein
VEAAKILQALRSVRAVRDSSENSEISEHISEKAVREEISELVSWRESVESRGQSASAPDSS